MRNRPQAIILSGLFAATIIAALALYVSYRSGASVPSEVAVPAAPQTPPEPVPQPPVLAAYTNDTYGFSVLYPDTVTPLEDSEKMSVLGYIPSCDPDTAIVCFPYGKKQYAGTNFESAAFSVHLLKKLKTEKTCLAAQSDELVDGEARVGGVTYKKFSFGDAATSHRLEGEHYRVFRGRSCFELSTSVASTVFEVWEPGTIRLFTDADRSAVQSALDAMLTSLRFTATP